VIRPPSNQKSYDAFYSRDEAFVQSPSAPADADEKQLEAHAEAVSAYERMLKRAQDTGDWAELMLEGAQPTKFELRPLPGHVFRLIVDMWNGGQVGDAEANLLLVRAALVGVVNLGKATVVVAVDRAFPKLGPIASVEVPNLLDRADPRILAELAAGIRSRAMGLSPL
jgi:hypothetical protein